MTTPTGKDGSMDTTRTDRDETCEGYSNYETFSVAVVIDNDKGSYTYWRERAREELATAKADQVATVGERARWNLADALEDHVRSEAPELTEYYSSLLLAGISGVDWREIADGWCSEVETGEYQ